MAVNSRRLGFLAAALLLLPTCTRPTAVDDWQQVVRIIDGDTLVLADGRRVRLLGIDAPEMGFGDGISECYGPEATAFLLVLVDEAGWRLRLEYDEVRFDHYGRTLAYLWDGEGRMLNQIILREGYAVFIPYSDALRWWQRLDRAGEEARLAQRGLWHPDACP